MSMATALSNIFSLERQRARYSSQRIEGSEPIPALPTSPATDSRPAEHTITPPSSAATITSTNTSATLSAATSPLPSRSEQEVEYDDHVAILSDMEQGGAARNGALRSSVTSQSRAPSRLRQESLSDDDDDDDDDDEEDGGSDMAVANRNQAGRTLPSDTQGHHMLTLAELEEERELARRRSSACVLLAVFVLFRLWIEAIQSGDFGLLLLSLVGTITTARWIRHNREHEEELDRRIAQVLQQAEATAGGAAGDRTAGETPFTMDGITLDRSELRMLSFQAQLALAIMESQRVMMQGGYGHPDGGAGAARGVSERTKASWDRFTFKTSANTAPSTKGGYGSVGLDEKSSDLAAKTDPNGGTVEDLTCSICLSEYEPGETVIKLPCSHLYHEECIGSWTTNHTKCPLCNLDLETAHSTPTTTPVASSNAVPVV